MAAYRGSPLKFMTSAILAGLATVTLAGPSAAATPTLMWSGAKRLNILCNVAGGPGIDQAAMSAQLCRDVERLAAKGATMPLRVILLGDPAALATDTVTLLVHASVTFNKRDRLLAFHMRPYRSTAGEADVLFGAVPRAEILLPAGRPNPPLDAALAAALSETLPWLARPRGVQRID